MEAGSPSVAALVDLLFFTRRIIASVI